MHIINIYISYLKTVRAIQILWVLFKHSMRELFTNRRRRSRREGELGTLSIEQLAEKMRFEVENKIV